MLALKPLVNRFITPFHSNNVGLIAVDFAIEKLHLVQLQKMASGDIGLQACSSVSYPVNRDEVLSAPKLLRSILKEEFKSNYFLGRCAISAMPSKDVRIISVAYQTNKYTNDSEAIINQVKDRIDGNIFEYVIDYLPVRTNESSGEQLAVVAIAERETVHNYLELLRQSGLQIDALDIRPAAIKRLIVSMSEEEDYKNVLVINFGTEDSYLTIISGRRLLLDHQLKIGSHYLLESMSETLEMSMESVQELIQKHGFKNNNVVSGESKISFQEITKTLTEVAKPKFNELAKEIKRILNYAASEARGESITEIYLLGSVSQWSGADALLTELINIPVTTIQNPLNKFSKQFETKNSENFNFPALSVATGLALRGLTDSV